jgi:hypothetical protein
VNLTVPGLVAFWKGEDCYQLMDVLSCWVEVLDCRRPGNSFGWELFQEYSVGGADVSARACRTRIYLACAAGLKPDLLKTHRIITGYLDYAVVYDSFPPSGQAAVFWDVSYPPLASYCLRL